MPVYNVDYKSQGNLNAIKNKGTEEQPSRYIVVAAASSYQEAQSKLELFEPDHNTNSINKA